MLVNKLSNAFNDTSLLHFKVKLLPVNWPVHFTGSDCYILFFITKGFENLISHIKSSLNFCIRISGCFSDRRNLCAIQITVESIFQCLSWNYVDFRTTNHSIRILPLFWSFCPSHLLYNLREWAVHRNNWVDVEIGLKLVPF